MSVINSTQSCREPFLNVKLKRIEDLKIIGYFN